MKESSDKKEEVPAGKTKFICAINENELNKVELAFFKRQQPQYILSDKYLSIIISQTYFYRDANRMIKGQELQYLSTDRKPVPWNNGGLVSALYGQDKPESGGPNDKNQGQDGYDLEYSLDYI